jgi:hypothetical protein
MTLRRLAALILAALLLVGPVGCGGDHDKGSYRGKDRPTPPIEK